MTRAAASAAAAALATPPAEAGSATPTPQRASAVEAAPATRPAEAASASRAIRVAVRRVAWRGLRRWSWRWSCHPRSSLTCRALMHQAMRGKTRGVHASCCGGKEEAGSVGSCPSQRARVEELVEELWDHHSSIEPQLLRPSQQP